MTFHDIWNRFFQSEVKQVEEKWRNKLLWCKVNKAEGCDLIFNDMVYPMNIYTNMNSETWYLHGSLLWLPFHAGKRLRLRPPLQIRDQSPSESLCSCQIPFLINPVINRTLSIQVMDSKGAERVAGHVPLLSVTGYRKWHTSVTLVWIAI